MTLNLFKRRTIWWPTRWGWAGLSAIFGIFAALWCLEAEPFLSQTERQPADILVVEGWIGIEGITAAKAEFEGGGYRFIVAAGGMSGNRWDRRQWSYATEAEELLLRLGLPRDQVILATPQDVQSHRTFASAVAVVRTLQSRGLQAKAINIFTLGAHARRSRLVYAKVQQPGTEVGVISWIPPGYYSGPWWRSSDRALELIKESVGYLFEVLLNSGRLSNSTSQPVLGAVRLPAQPPHDGPSDSIRRP